MFDARISGIVWVIFASFDWLTVGFGNHGPIITHASYPLKVFKAWASGFFQGKMLQISNISGYKDIIETKFGTWTDFTVLNIFKSQWYFVWSRDMSRDTFPENFTYLKNCQQI